MALSTPSAGRVITPDLSEFVEKLRVKHNVPGLALAVAFKDGTREAAAWGKSTESGEPMTTEVSTFHTASLLVC